MLYIVKSTNKDDLEFCSNAPRGICYMEYNQIQNF